MQAQKNAAMAGVDTSAPDSAAGGFAVALESVIERGLECLP